MTYPREDFVKAVRKLCDPYYRAVTELGSYDLTAGDVLDFAARYDDVIFCGAEGDDPEADAEAVAYTAAMAAIEGERDEEAGRARKEAEGREFELMDWAEAVEKEATRQGWIAETFHSASSEAIYLNLSRDGDELKIRLADHEARPTYEAMFGLADFEIGNHGMANPDFEAAFKAIKKTLQGKGY